MTQTTPEHPHPSVFIREELEARGWTMDTLAVRMGPESGVNRLSMDLYFEVGPTEPSFLLGNLTAKQLGKAFGVSPDFFLNLHRAWLDAQHQEAVRAWDHRCSSYQVVSGSEDAHTISPSRRSTTCVGELRASRAASHVRVASLASSMAGALKSLVCTTVPLIRASLL